MIRENFSPEILKPTEKALKLSFQEVVEGDPDYEQALAVRALPEQAKEEVEAQAQEMLAEKHWYLQDYWIKKKPKEKIKITAGEVAVEVYNFHNQLEEWQLAQLQRSVADYARLRNNEVFGQVRHILIDDKQPVNPHDGQEMNGYAGKDGAIKLYPRALRPIPHRVPGASNLEGTVIHELSHRLGHDFEERWSKEFGWTMLDESQPLPGGTELRDYVNAEPERCITAYATINAAEDICESMVAAMRNPQALDSSRYQRIEEELLPEKGTGTITPVVEIQREDINIPEIVAPVKYKRVARRRMAMSP